jgi:predicted ATPase
MRLDYVKIDQFKNLNDFEVDFDARSKEPVTVLLGRNGSGKSNFLEALVIIFRDLREAKTTTSFAYDLRYTLQRGTLAVRIWNPPIRVERSLKHSQSRRFMSKERHPITAFTFIVTFKGQARRIPKNKISEFLPNYVVTYYSGISNRLEHHFFPPQLKFRNELLAGKVIPLRPLFYAKPIHSNFALLAFFMAEDEEVSDFLRDYPWIEAFESALFVLKRPHWAKSQRRRKDGDPRFWYAGGVVKEFLSCVYDCCLAPLRIKGDIQVSFDKKESTEFVYLYLRDLERLQKLARESVAAIRSKGQSKTPRPSEAFRAVEFFKLLESTYMSDLIHETRIRVQVRHAGVLTFRELSEGEQQLLTVVGMLRFTRDEDSLFLLDEPDTHLNPAWGMEYLNILRTHADTGKNSHLLLATHDPLVLTNLRRNQVVIFERDDNTGRITCSEPELDPVGMGVQGILRNMFGLRSAVGTEVQEKLDERARLAALDKDRSPKEEAEFKKLSEELMNLGFGREFRDPDYAQFVRAMARRPEFRKPVLTQVEQKNQEELADEILNEILEEEKTK